MVKVSGRNNISLVPYRSLNRGLSRRMRRIASGKINTADSPSSKAVDEKLRAVAAEINRRGLNREDYLYALRTSDGHLGRIQASLRRIRELLVRGSGTLMSRDDKEIIQGEIDAYVRSIRQTVKRSRLGSLPEVKRILAPLAKIHLRRNPRGSITETDRAMGAANLTRSRVGARSNRAFMNIKGKAIYFLNLSAARSRIGDADIAWESIQYHRDFVMFKMNVKLRGKR